MTGSNFLLTGPAGGKVLVDCGLFQGARIVENKNYEPFPYAPEEIEALFVTHAHLDHIGRIPKLVGGGFGGRIYSTPPTKEIAALSLIDSLGVMTKEIKRTKRPVFYDEEDVKRALVFWQTVEYHEKVTVGEWDVVFKDAGHILGSAMIEFTHRQQGTKIVFTGDLGGTPAPLLPETEPLAGADYLVIESVYGDRNHETHEEARAKLEDVIEETIGRGGTLLIPAFSIERTQALLYEIEKMAEESRIPLVPVFLDSPLAIGITAIYKKYQNYLHVSDESSRGGLFNFPQLRKTLKTEESQAIDRLSYPKIIIAGAGMSNGGRIVHHEKHFLPDKRSTLLLVGYQTAGSLGRLLQDGLKQVKILGEEVPVRARVVTLSGYSAHKDADGLLNFVSAGADSLRQVFVAMGEPRASLHFVQRLRDYLGLQAVAPQLNETVRLM